MDNENNSAGLDAIQTIGATYFMKWYYKIMGGHTHVRVFMNGAKCGDLCFRNEEFKQLFTIDPKFIIFIKEDSEDAH